MNGDRKETMMKRQKRQKRLKEQNISTAKPKGLPAPTELAAKINAAGMSGDEVLAWLGAVLSKASLGGAPSEMEAPSVPAVDVAPPPSPTPKAVEENFENKLLNTLLNDIRRDFGSIKNTRKKK